MSEQLSCKERLKYVVLSLWEDGHLGLEAELQKTEQMQHFFL